MRDLFSYCVLFVIWCAVCCRLSSFAQAWKQHGSLSSLYSSLLVSLTCSLSLKHTRTHSHTHTHWLLYWVWGHIAFNYGFNFISFSPLKVFSPFLLIFWRKPIFHSLKSGFLDMWSMFEIPLFLTTFFVFSPHFHVFSASPVQLE